MSRKLLVAGHQLGFFVPLADHLRGCGYAIREDHWMRHGSHEQASSSAAAAWADVVICEWCLGNAVWYSGALDRQPLVVRFHRSELETGYPRALDLESVQRIVFVAEHVRAVAAERFDWPGEMLDVIPNAVDIDHFARPKLPGSDLNLAVVGWVPQLKRLDRALDLLERLRAEDRRFRLLVKGRGPEGYDWMASRKRELEYFAQLRRRIAGSPLLGDAVAFEREGDDVADFLQQAGFIVSSSDVEGDAVSVVEGMASGSVPVVFERPGAVGQYGARWVHPDTDAAANWIFRRLESGALPAEQAAARRRAGGWGRTTIGARWEKLLAVL